jgi:hypothetical protein
MVMYGAIFFMNIILKENQKIQNAPTNLICHETSFQIFYKWISIFS